MSRSSGDALIFDAHCPRRAVMVGSITTWACTPPVTSYSRTSTPAIFAFSIALACSSFHQGGMVIGPALCSFADLPAVELEKMRLSVHRCLILRVLRGGRRS